MMTKYLILVALLCYSVQSFACNRSIDNQSVILFVDANNSPREIESARSAACERGENLVVVDPDDYEVRVNQLARSGVAITSLIASGHDGGGKL